jgi:hypothetical protein
MAACTNDFVAVIDATPSSATFGTILKVADVPWCGAEPHHAGISADGKVRPFYHNSVCLQAT